MPKMSGNELLKELRSLGLSMPVVEQAHQGDLSLVMAVLQRSPAVFISHSQMLRANDFARTTTMISSSSGLCMLLDRI